MAASGRDRRVRIPTSAIARQYRFDAMFEVPAVSVTSSQ